MNAVHRIVRGFFFLSVSSNTLADDARAPGNKIPIVLFRTRIL